MKQLLHLKFLHQIILRRQQFLQGHAVRVRADVNAEDFSVALAAFLTTEIVIEAKPHLPYGDCAERILLGRCFIAVIPYCLQVRKDDHIIKLVFRQMVVIQEFVDQAVMFCGKLLLLLC